MISLPNPRYERKFIAEGFALSEALALVRRHRAAFREVYPCRTINNIYLDSPSRSAYYDHINGISLRLKHRVRWYGELGSDISTPALERKFKRGSISGKDSHGLSAFHLNGEPIRTALATAFNTSDLPERLRTELRNLEPCLINQYQRQYFTSADSRFRLTVDYDFRFGAPVGGTRILRASGVPAAVLELKYEVQYAGDASSLTNSIPFRLARCSKFVLGIEQL